MPETICAKMGQYCTKWLKTMFPVTGLLYQFEKFVPSASVAETKSRHACTTLIYTNEEYMIQSGRRSGKLQKRLQKALKRQCRTELANFLRVNLLTLLFINNKCQILY